MQSLFLRIGVIAAFTGVGLGAFGAHGLKTIVTPEMLEVYKTGVTYQMWHAMALILVALLQQISAHSKLLTGAGCSFVAGIVLFSGSLYCLALSSLKWLGIITPFGGLAFLVGWLLLTIFAFKRPDAA